MGKNYDYSYEWDIKYCYPNSFTLRNKFNITNSEEFSIAEMEYTSLTIAEVKENPIKGDFNLKHLQDIHRHIFRDIYDWAGELRTVNISKGHSFREGNGRAQRVMIEYLAKVAGYTIDFLNISDIEMIEASIDAFNFDYDKMARIFRKITKHITKEEQEDFIKIILNFN